MDRRSPRRGEQLLEPEHFASILARAAALGSGADQVAIPSTTGGSGDPETSTEHEQEPGKLRQWFLHETSTMREPIYRTSAEDSSAERNPVAREPAQLPIVRYDYGNNLSVISQFGELTARDLRVMSVISQIFWESGCPDDNGIYGDEATLGFLCRQLGLNRGYIGLVRSSIERLASAKVVMRREQTIIDSAGTPTGTDEAEVAIGFLTNWGRRRRKIAGQPEVKSNFILIDPIIAELIRRRHFTWLRADVMRKLANHALATKYYTFMRTHRPNDRGEIEYGVMNLAAKLGCRDKKKSRVRAKLILAAETVCKVAPDEFPRVHLRGGIRDDVIVQAKVRNVQKPPLRVIEEEAPALPRRPMRRAG